METKFDRAKEVILFAKKSKNSKIVLSSEERNLFWQGKIEFIASATDVIEEDGHIFLTYTDYNEKIIAKIMMFDCNISAKIACD